MTNPFPVIHANLVYHIALKPELAAKKAVRAEVEAALTPRQQLQAYLIDIPVDLDGVVKPLSALTTIWDSVRTHAALLLKSDIDLIPDIQIRSDLTVIQQTMSSSDVQAQQVSNHFKSVFQALS